MGIDRKIGITTDNSRTKGEWMHVQAILSKDESNHVINIPQSEKLSVAEEETWSESLKTNEVKKDSAKNFKSNQFIFQKTYTENEIPLIEYVITKIVDDILYDSIIVKTNPFSCVHDPEIHTINTDVDIMKKVYSNILFFTLEFSSIVKLVFNVQNQLSLLEISASSQENLDNMIKLINETLAKENFYRGKTLKFTYNSIEFVKDIDRSIDSVIIDSDIREAVQLNVIDFLTKKNLSKITNKRAILLSGPPGTGKSSLASALFSSLNNSGVTKVFLSEDIFKKYGSIENLFNFFHSYLSPLFVVFEDIDLIGYSREQGISNVIGPLLSALNGIENPKYENDTMVILATTNMFEILDQALVRPCRFDRHFIIDYPTKEQLKKMFVGLFGFEPPKELYACNDKKVAESDKRYLKNNVLTGAHIKEIYNTAKLIQESTGCNIKEAAIRSIKEIEKSFFVVTGGKNRTTSKFGFYDSDDVCEADESTWEGA